MNSDHPIRIAVVESTRLFCDVLATVLRDQDRIELVGGLDPVAPPDVDVVVVDATQGGPAALIRVQDLRLRLRTVKLLVLGMTAVEEEILHFLEAGVHGYVLADSSLEQFFEAVEAVHRGDPFYPARVVRSVFERIGELSGHRPAVKPRALTAREEEVLKLVAEGLSNKEIARELRIAVYTVKNHIHSILDKLQVPSRQAATLTGYELGLLDHDWIDDLPPDLSRFGDRPPPAATTGRAARGGRAGR